MRQAAFKLSRRAFLLFAQPPSESTANERDDDDTNYKHEEVSPAFSGGNGDSPPHNQHLLHVELHVIAQKHLEESVL
jgi:hypothetical protein